MSEETKIREAMSALHASSDLYEQVTKRASGVPRRRSGHALPITAAICLGLIGTLATAGVAGAIATADPLFFIHAWGNHGQDEEISWDVPSNSDEFLYSATRSYEGVDAEKASEDMASAVEGVGMSCELRGYTLTINSMVMDSNGCGAATYTLSNPNGIQHSTQYGFPGELIFNDSAHDFSNNDINAIYMRMSAQEFGLNRRIYYDESTSTSTELRGTIYFDSMGTFETALEGFKWGVSCLESEGKAVHELKEETDVFVPSIIVEAKQFSDGAGSVVNVSPLSLQLVLDKNVREEFTPHRVVLKLTDGSEHVIEDDDAGIYNRYMSSYSDDRSSLTMVFTGLVDVGQIESISVEGPLGRKNMAYEFVASS